MALFARSKIKVLICDDSVIVRTVILRALESDPEIEVVGQASNPFEARDMIIELKPDVLTLDIEMPRLDGLSFLKIIMKERPMPVIIISSLSQSGSNIALEALQSGAVEVMGKPSGSFAHSNFKVDVINKVKAAYATLKGGSSTSFRQAQAYTPPPSSLGTAPQCPNDTLILLGASTGGTEALKEVLIKLPDALPPILIVQHIPPHFSRAFANRLNELCAFKVSEAVDGDRALPGTALVAPGDFHMVVRRLHAGFGVSLSQAPQVWHQRPAVDVLFRSALKMNPRNIVVALLTGMGKDGAEGMLELRNAGARTFAQDEASCVVYGMPRAANQIGAAEKMVPLNNMHQAILSALPRI